MEELEFIKQTKTARREITAGTWAEAIRTAAAFLKELANGEALGLQYVEPLDSDQEMQKSLPYVQATELDSNCHAHTLRVTIKTLDTATREDNARYELQFTRYTLDEARLNKASNR